MKLKKHLLLILTAAIAFNSLSFKPPVSAQEVLSKRVYVNVAQNKPVSSNQAENESYPFSNLVDGRKTSFVIPANGTDSSATEFIVDLQRRYRIEKIELCSRFDGAADQLGRQYFELLGANKEDFSDGVVLDGMNEQNDELFPSSGCFTSVQNGEKAYRFIKLKRTGGGYYGYSELMVFAEQTVTELSRNKAVTTNEGSAVSGDNAVNGTNSDDSDAWVNDYLNEYNYISVDLEKSLPVGMIELEGRNITSENPATRQNIKIYGSNSIEKISEYASSASLSEDDGFKTLSYIRSMGANYLYDIFPFGKYPAMYQAVLDESEAFRYITMKNTTLHSSAFGEIRAFAVNPEVVSVSWDEEFIYVGFSDEMNEDTSSYITLTDSEGLPVSAEVTRGDDEYSFKINTVGLDKKATYKLCADSAAESSKGVSLAEKFELTINMLKTLTAEKITFHDGIEGIGEAIDNLYGQKELSAKGVVSNSSVKSKSVSLFVALYDEEGRLRLINEANTSIPSATKKELVAALSIDEEITDKMKVKAFLWDMTENAISPLEEMGDLSVNKTNIYVSPKGSDDGLGTKPSPFKTIERAKAEVLMRNDEMTEDINVYLRGGTYALKEPVVFDENDSGKNGYYVNYRAVEGEEVIISGGTEITGWRLEDAEKNIYSAPVSGIDDIRNLYVNGVSARAARSEGRIKPLRFYYENEIARGFYVSSEDIGLYENPEDIRLFYTQVWKYTLLPVADIKAGEAEGENIIIMQDKAFSVAADNDTYLPVTTENAFYVENAKELLDVSGEFYFDKKDNVLYYMAAEGEDMENSVSVVPTTERLLQIEGSDLSKKVRNISFSGIHFAHTKRNDIADGYLGGQAQGVTPLVDYNTAYPLDTTIVGADIRIMRAEDVVFENNTFSGLASVAIGVYEGSNDIVIRGNSFYDIGDSAVTVGLPSDAYMENAYYDEDENYLGRNVALYKPAKDANGGTITENANDGDAKTVWTTNYISNYWQTDLGKEYSISQIRIKSRLNYASNPNAYEQYELYRRNFKVLGSNDENFTDGGTLLAQQGDAAFDFATGFIGDVETNEKFRFIRVVKTQNEHFPLADIEVISPDVTTPLKEVSKRTVIDNNYITRIGEFNLGAPGIQLYYTEEACVSHNTIKDVPYSGICVGWGWLNTTDSTTAKNNKVLNNHIENYAMRTYDAGGVYLLGTQHGNLVEGNYLRNQPNAYYAFYSDSGSVGFTVKNNVFSKVDTSFAIGTSYSASDKTDMTITDNWSTTPECTINFTDENSLIEAPTVFIESDIPAAAQNIINNAGLEDEYKVVAQNVPEGRWSLSVEDIYGDIIDHHLVSEGSYSGESMPDTTLISYYLSPKIVEAKKVLELGEADATADAVSLLNDAIDAAKAKETLFKNQGYGYNNTTIVPIDRLDLINTRVALIEAIDRFVEELK